MGIGLVENEGKRPRDQGTGDLPTKAVDNFVDGDRKKRAKSPFCKGFVTVLKYSANHKTLTNHKVKSKPGLSSRL
jgi:hypothetical protein